MLYSMDMKRQIRLRPRLQAVADMVEPSGTLADIGCDHGRLCVALLQQGKIRSAIASDISEPSLTKARELAAACGLSDSVVFQVSDGLMDIPVGTEMLVFSGMGGELIAQLLSQSPQVARSARRILMQPMGGTAELRQYLFLNHYEIFDEILVEDGGRIYQVLAARDGEPQKVPDGFSGPCYDFGYLLFEKRDPLLLPLLEARRSGHQKRLELAKAKGQVPESLLSILSRLDTLIRIVKEMQA